MSGTGRRSGVLLSVVTCAVLVIVGCSSSDDSAAANQQEAACPSGLTETDEICVDRNDPQASQIVEAVRSQFRPGVLSGVVFGVWKDGEAVATGALGESQPGIPATRDVHFRIGNVVESQLATRLLELVEDGKVALDDPVSRWFPSLPNADKVTLNMLVHSTSGYEDYVTTDAFIDALEKNPFQVWEVDPLIRYGMSRPPAFEPGTSWAFSDTNFLLLGQIVEQVAGRPLGEQLQRIYDELGMDDTALSITSAIRSPVLHGYTTERGPFEDATFWSPSWALNTANGTSTIDDMRVWAEALAEGTVLTPESHELQLAPETAGLGPMTAESYYGMGVIVGGGWVGSNPQFDGYSGIVAYHPATRTTVVVYATIGSEGNIAQAYGTTIYDEITNVVTPGEKLPVAALPRGQSGNG